jgi:hypothetical protein
MSQMGLRTPSSSADIPGSLWAGSCDQPPAAIRVDNATLRFPSYPNSSVKAKREHVQRPPSGDILPTGNLNKDTPTSSAGFNKADQDATHAKHFPRHQAQHQRAQTRAKLNTRFEMLIYAISSPVVSCMV